MMPMRRNNQSWLPSIFNDFFDNEWMERANATAPAINVIENDKEYRVELAAPGMTKEDFDVHIDEDNNLERWLKGECCIFRMNHSEQPMSVNIGKDIEALYNFLCFCYKLNTNQRISDEFRDYLALTITRSCSDCWEEC